MDTIDIEQAIAAVNAVTRASNTGPGGPEGYVQILARIFRVISADHGSWKRIVDEAVRRVEVE